MNHCHKSTENVLTVAQQTKLLDLVRCGIGVVAVHASYYSFLEWDEVHEFYGTRFTVHGSSKAVLQVRMLDKEHPIMADLPDSFEVVSELYESQPLPDDRHLLAESREKGTDIVHPSVWTRMYGKGRIVTILPGHWADNYRVEDFQTLINNSVLWAAGRLD